MLKFFTRVVRVMFSQMVMVGLLLVLQLGFIVVAAVRLSEYFLYIYVVLVLLSIIVVLHIINSPGSPAGKLAWVVPIMIFPLLGGLFYLMVYGQRHPSYVSRRLYELQMYGRKFLPDNPQAGQLLAQTRPDAKKMLSYMVPRAGASLHQNTETRYYTVGEDMKAAMIEAIENARHYVFLEFFIIKDGVFWREIRDLLAKKAAQGVDVRLMYDGMGCLAHLPAMYPRKLKAQGIKAKVFSPFTPFLSAIQNNRDHRKIVVIDGHTAFCGGINLADEYINVTHPYGHWKDTGIRLRGDGAWAFTVMFMDLWNLTEDTLEDYDTLRPAEMPEFLAGGYVMPYGDSPMDSEKVGEYMYMHAINGARNYLHIMSPYLILEQSMVDAMINAAKSGVDVKLIVPAQADHWYAHAVAKAYFHELISGGVQIYEYSPGFIHAKSFVWDDDSAIVGTINLDYRSLYLHFECAVWLCGCQTVADIEADFQQTLAKCRRLSAEDALVRNPFKKVLYSVLRIFAPLM